MSLSKACGGLGFRDLVSFNQALLAKQIWRLWKTPDSLTAKIMKAKYYPECSVLEADCGKKPSFVWHSIQSSCDLVKEGLLWRVGNGNTIRIWQDKWLPSPTTYKVVSPPRVLNPNATVSSLIDGVTKWWKIELLEQLFSREEIQSIQSLPISATDQEDGLFWRGTANGAFSVKSAYHIHKERDLATTPARSSGVRHSTIWRNIWQLNIPNAEKHFLWCACHNILPTRVNLCSWQVLTESSCPICMREPETVFHSLWQCPSASDVWSAGCTKFQKSSFEGPDFLQVVEAMFSKCDRLEFFQFVGIARRIWLRRNEVIHGGPFLHPSRIVQQATQAMEVFQALRSGSKITPPPADHPTINPWMAPPNGWFKANWDAGVNRRKGCVGIGVVIRDHQGKMWASKCQTCPGLLDPPAAEAVASFMAAQLCLEMGIR